jgi:hypothetical protein
MRATVGLFPSRADAERAVDRLRARGIAPDRINLLVPGADPSRLAAVPTTDTEQPGTGAAVGGVVGGAVGASAVAAATALVPGIGPITAIGLLAGALIGAGGGVAVGDTLEGALAHGVPKDELFWYEDALRRGRSLLIVLTDADDETEAARQFLAESGAESLDAAREQWWVGLRPAEAEHYAAQGGDFARDEAAFRRGFEAALQRETRDRRFEDVVEYVRRRDPVICATEAYRRGFERGQTHARRLREAIRPPRAA